MSFAAVWLAFRSILWALLLPGVVAVFVPWRYFGLRPAALDLSNPFHWLDLAIVILGAALLVTCVWEFARTGRGTLSPMNPPRVLVVKGLYRYVRNPMYLSVTLILLGEALLLGSPELLAYWAAWFLLVNLFVLAYEEPKLRRQFGQDFVRYCETVSRWVPGRPGQA